MFNVTIIKLKDIIKIFFILVIIYCLSKFVLKSSVLKDSLNMSNIVHSNEFLTFGINCQSNVIKNISKAEIIEEKTEEIENGEKALSIESILKIGANIFNTKEQEIEPEVGQDNSIVEENVTNPVNEEINQVTTQVITENPIPENYNKEYSGIKIKNETSYDLTEEILNPDNLSINKNNIIIFHTHTCESYTQSEKYSYTPSRKLQNNRFELFCFESRR